MCIFYIYIFDKIYLIVTLMRAIKSAPVRYDKTGNTILIVNIMLKVCINVLAEALWSYC